MDVPTTVPELLGLVAKLSAELRESRYDWAQQQRALEICMGALSIISANDGSPLVSPVARADATIYAVTRHYPKWRPPYMRRTYIIEVKADFDDPNKYTAVEEMCRLAAQRLLIQANMLEDGRRPQVAYRSEDYFLGTEQLSIDLPEEE